MNADLFNRLCAAHGIPPASAEYRFHPQRRWRFDFAWPGEGMLALECQGGIFARGRHVRGAALLKEHEKLNAAACLNWAVLFCTPKDIMNGTIFPVIKRALECREKLGRVLDAPNQ